MSRTTALARRLAITVFTTAFLIVCLPAQSRDIFVSPNGNDSNTGTLEKPLATLAKATAVVAPGDTCFLRQGVYREVLRPGRSGEAGKEITFAAYQDEVAVLSGADPVTDWKDEGDGVWSAPIPWSLGDGNQVFSNSKMLPEASWPAAGGQHLFQPIRASASGGSPTTLVCPQIPGPDGAWKGARLRCAGGSAWICWTANVTGYDAAGHTLTFDKAQDKWYVPREGSLFSLRGLPCCLHAPGQWFHDKERKRLLFIPPDNTNPGSLAVEAKRREFVADLNDRSHIRLVGLSFRAGAIRTDDKSSHLAFEKLRGQYVGHNCRRDDSSSSGLILHGRSHLVLDCDIGYSSAAVLSVKGSDHRIINCHLHHGTYGGLWHGAVRLGGRRILFSHNTVQHAGRDLIGTFGLMESLVQFNDVSEAGWLTKDLGMFYGHDNDFANTQFRYNLVHDNRAAHCAMGIYFDHLSHNAIVHHNVVWNVGMDPLRFNNPSYGNLVFNNTCWNTGKVSTFDHSKRDDLFANRFTDNIFSKPAQLPDHVAGDNNHVVESPPFRDPAKLDFRLTSSQLPGAGAMPSDTPPFRAGCRPGHPPNPLPRYEPANVPWMNGITNACFEFGSTEGWQEEPSTEASLTKGNGWGNGFGRGEVHATGTSKFELQLGPKPGGISQKVDGLLPNTDYELSAWLRVSDPKQQALLGVRDHGGKAIEVSSSDPAWTRKVLKFTTGPEAGSATLFIRKTSPGPGKVWADNFVLPLRPGS